MGRSELKLSTLLLKPWRNFSGQRRKQDGSFSLTASQFLENRHQLWIQRWLGSWPECSTSCCSLGRKCWWWRTPRTHRYKNSRTHNVWSVWLIASKRGAKWALWCTGKTCVESGMRAGKFCPSHKEVSLPKYLENTASCSYHQILNLNKEGTHQINSSCYNISESQQKSWFMLPAVQAWYYQQHHPNYEATPSFLPKCEINAF